MADEQVIDLADLTEGDAPTAFQDDALTQRMRAFGYTTETMQFMLRPMITELRDPLGSMGNDSALACLSDKSRMIYDYFKQLFAQVTNPAIDSIREEVVMSLSCFMVLRGTCSIQRQSSKTAARRSSYSLREELAALSINDRRA